MTIEKRLYDVVKVGDLDGLRVLIDEDNVRISVDTPFGSLLHVAASKGHLDIVKYLVGEGAEININAGILEGSPLDSAASHGHLEVVRYLFEQGAELDVSESKRNPLFGAIHGGHLEVARYLIDAGIDTQVKYSGDTMQNMDALAFAKEWGQSEIVALLEES